MGRLGFVFVALALGACQRDAGREAPQREMTNDIERARTPEGSAPTTIGPPAREEETAPGAPPGDEPAATTPPPGSGDTPPDRTEPDAAPRSR